MVVTIQTASAGLQSIGMFEAMKHGLDAEPYADNTFDVVVQNLDKAKTIAEMCKGKILTVLERTEYPYYQ